MSFYRDLLVADSGGLCTYSLVEQGVAPLRKLRKGLERGISVLPASTLRGRLFRASRSHPIAPLLREVESDVILSHITFPALARRLRRASPPIIWSSQGISPPGYYEAAGPVSYREVIAFYEALSQRAAMLLIWTESGAQRLSAEARLGAPITVLPPVLPITRSSVSLTRMARVHVLFVGRDAKRKGLYDLIAACEWLNENSSDWMLDIVSRPSVDLCERITRLGNAQLHLGLTDEAVAQLMERADILVLPTYAETYGYVLIEAMARGTALISTNAPPMNELVQDGVNGALVPAGDVVAITEQLDSLLHDEELLANMKANAKKYYEENFAPEVVLSRYHKLYRSVARSK